MSAVSDKYTADHAERAEQPYTHDEKHASVEDVGGPNDIDAGFDPAVVKRIMRKVDWRLIPILAAMYTVSLIDRANLGLARAANNVQFDKDLHTNKGEGYSIVTLVFFVPYIIFELPSQIGLRKFGPRIWLGAACTAWGVIMLAMGFAKTWQALAGLRVALGFFEAALFPGASFLISTWYPRRSMASRNVIFYISSVVVGGFANPVGYAFSLLHGRAGLHGWQWIFILFGIITVVVGLAGALFLVDFPDKAQFLNADEREIIKVRINRDRSDAEYDPMTWAKVGKYAMDPKPWLFAFFFMSSTVASYSLAYFSPTILASMGYNNVESMLLNTPCNFWALVPALSTAYLADKYPGFRAPAIMFNAMCLVIGTALYSKLGMSFKAARYVGIFLAVGGCNSNVPLVLSWAQTSIRGQSKRAFTSALAVAGGGIGGIMAGVVFMNKEARKGFPTGVNFTIGVNVATITLSFLLSLWMRWENKKAQRGEKVIEGHEEFRYQP